MGAAQLVVGLDIGTTGAKATIFDEEGRVVSGAYAEYKLYHRDVSLSELNPDEVWTAIKRVLRESVIRAKVEPREVKAISTAVLGEAFIPIDKEGRPLYWSMTTFDARAVDQVAWWEENFGAEEMFKITGQPLSVKIPIYTLQKIQWLRENEPEVFRRTWKFLCWEDYFNFKLTGEPVTDYTVATRTMMFDIRQKSWSERILNLAGLDEDLLPDVRPSGHVVGEVDRRAAEDTGLKEGTLVITGGHDQPCGALGAGILDEGKLMDATGTVECYGVVQNRLILNDEMRLQGYAVHVYVLEDRYFMFGFTPTGGSVLRWFRDQFGREELERAKREGKDVYGILTAEASEAEPGAKDLFFYPYYEGSGTPVWNREVRGAIIGLTLAHSRREVIRAILESLAFELRRNIETIRSHGIEVHEVRAVGGGAKSPFWLQLKADITGSPILVPEAKMEATALGAAILAAKGAGIYGDIGEAVSSMSRISERYEPDPALRNRYDKLYRRYLKFQEVLLDAYTSE